MLLVPLTTVFYQVFLASNRTRILVRLSLVSIILNLLFCLFCMQFLGLAGIALGTTLICLVQLCVCGYLVQKDIGNLGMRDLTGILSKISVGTLVAAFCLWAGLHFSAGMAIANNNLFLLVRLLLLGLIGGLAYFLTCHILRVEEIGNGLAQLRDYRKGLVG
jgi:putative peptidoglycan lipid II flippase